MDLNAHGNKFLWIVNALFAIHAHPNVTIMHYNIISVLKQVLSSQVLRVDTEQSNDAVSCLSVQEMCEMFNSLHKAPSLGLPGMAVLGNTKYTKYQYCQYKVFGWWY